MADNEGQSDTVSKEAHERVQRENATLKEQLEKATGTLGSYTKRDKARAALKAKGVSDPDAIADLITPHLDDVELDAIPEFLDQDRFKVLMTAGAPPPPPNEDGDGSGTPATEPAQNGFTGPSPAGTGSGSQSMEHQQKIAVGSPEYKALVQKNDEGALKEAYEKGLIEEPSRPWG